MRVLFLDVDGVLNNRESVEEQKRYGVCPKLVKILKWIIDVTGCQIVLSSSWRLYDDYTAEIRAALQVEGMDILDKTIDLPPIKWSQPAHRSNEILEWLSRHPEVKEFAILDDSCGAEIEGHFFKTDSELGLTNEIAKKIIDHFPETEEQKRLRASFKALKEAFHNDLKFRKTGLENSDEVGTGQA